MTIRPLLVSRGVVFGLGLLLFSSCTSETSAEAPPPTNAQPTLDPDRALKDELVLVNRMLASGEIQVLGAFGHVSARSRTNPDRYFIAGAVSPALVNADDIYESDLDSQPVAGNGSDLVRERFVHGEIYKARPDVMAIVYTKAPILAGFSVSSVPLPGNNSHVPVFDTRGAAGGETGGISTSRLGQALAESLDSANSILVFGQGAVTASPSTNNLVSTALRLRMGAEQRLFEISLGGRLNHMVYTRETAIPEAGSIESVGPSGRAERIDRFAAFFNFLGARDLARTKASRSDPAQAPQDPDQAVVEELAIANRLLASPEIGVLTPDGLAHVSARSRTNPDHFFIAADIAPGMVTPADIIENDLDTTPVGGGTIRQFSERFIHSEIYRARPDIMAVVHAHTPELITFGQSSVKLRPVLGDALFIRDGLPIFDITQFTGGAPSPVSCAHCISTPELGRALAGMMGDKDGALLLDHGVALGASSVRGLVSRAYHLAMNGKIQQIAMALGGTVGSFEALGSAALARSEETDAPYPEWDYWKHKVLGSTDIHSVPAYASGLRVTRE